MLHLEAVQIQGVFPGWEPGEQTERIEQETAEQTYRRVFQLLKPRTAPPPIEVRFCQFADANSFIRLRGERLVVRITDVLEGAPAPVLEALAHILLAKLFRRPVPAGFQDRYRRHMDRRDVRRSVHLLREIRGRKFVAPPQGNHWDLVEMFEQLNAAHFHGLMAQPRLGWSRGPSRTMLGHYDPSHNAIIISRALDQPDIPRLLVEYVLFHEMLHLRYPVEHRAGRRSVHTAEFRRAEKEFPRLKEVKELLKRW